MNGFASPVLSLLAAAVLGIAAASRATRPPAADEPSTPVSVDAAQGGPSGTLVVLNKDESTAWLIDAATGEARAKLATGAHPHEVAVSPDGRRALVANYGSRSAPGHTLSVIDLAAKRVVATIDLGGSRLPHGIAWLPDGRRAVVTAEMDRAVVLVDVDSERVAAAIPTGHDGSHMLAVQADGRRVYTVNGGDGTATAIDLERRAVAGTGTAGEGAEGVALSPDGCELWVGNRDDNTVTVIDTRTMTSVATLPSARTPFRVAFTPDGRRAVVANPASGELRVFDAAARRLERAIVTGVRGRRGSPLGIAVSRDGAYVFATHGTLSAVTVASLDTGDALASYATGAGPDGIAFSPLVVP
jgi:YVTN family beta-propeller protein